MSSADPPIDHPAADLADDGVWTFAATGASADHADRDDRDEPASALGSPQNRRRLGRALGVVAVLIVSVVFARAAASEVRYETGPGSQQPVDPAIARLLAGSSGGTECGNWPGELSPSQPPEVPALKTAVWANIGSFHIRSSHIFVQSLRIDVENGTAKSGGDPSASLTIPFKAGETIDFTVSCDADAMTLHLLGGDGKDVTDAPLSVGAGPGLLAPLRVARDGSRPAPLACSTLRTAQEGFATALQGQDTAGAATKLLDAARITRDSVASQLTDEEQAAADLLITTLEERLGGMQAGDPSAIGPLSAEQQAAGATIAEAFKRICG
jgi:hypothetical protein